MVHSLAKGNNGKTLKSSRTESVSRLGLFMRTVNIIYSLCYYACCERTFSMILRENITVTELNGYLRASIRRRIHTYVPAEITSKFNLHTRAQTFRCTVISVFIRSFAIGFNDEMNIVSSVLKHAPPSIRRTKRLL